jgi:hypothetical protein
MRPFLYDGSLFKIHYNYISDSCTVGVIRTEIKFVRFEVFAVAITKRTIWDVMSLVEFYLRFEEAGSMFSIEG